MILMRDGHGAHSRCGIDHLVPHELQFPCIAPPRAGTAGSGGALARLFDDENLLWLNMVKLRGLAFGAEVIEDEAAIPPAQVDRCHRCAPGPVHPARGCGSAGWMQVSLHEVSIRVHS